jgi:hypothetical protein
MKEVRDEELPAAPKKKRAKKDDVIKLVSVATPREKAEQNGVNLLTKASSNWLYPFKRVIVFAMFVPHILC